MLALLHSILLVLALGGGTLPAPALRGASRVVSGQGAPRPIVELRERLRALPAAERARLEHHLTEFEALPPYERKELLERAKALRERERGLTRQAGEPRPRPAPGVERPPAGNAPGLRDEIRAQGHELRKRLPAELRKRLERAEPAQRRRLLERLAAERERFSHQALDGMRTSLSLSPREVRRLERLPVDQRLRAMRELSGASRGRPRH